MRIGVVGSGAMGSAIGGLLAESGLDVILIDKWRDHVDAMNANGLKIREKAGVRTIKVKATTDPGTVDCVDLVITLVKSYHTKDAIEEASSIIGERTAVLSLQNGLGNAEKLAEILGKDHVVAGVTHTGSVLLGPGEVVFGSEGRLTYIGELDGSITERVKEVVRLFNQAGLETKATDNITGIIWDKLLVNIAVSPLSAITRLPHGGLTKVGEVRECAFEAVSEAIRIAEADRVKLSVDDPAEVWLKATAGLPPEHKSSMLKDVEKGSMTEIDTINGAVVKLGKKYGIPTPVNKTLVTCLQGINFQQKMFKAD